MAITIDGVTYRNLQEQVGKNAEDIASLQDTQKKIISGDVALGKATVKGTVDIEGKLTAGGDAEIDGTLSLNSPDNLTFKTGVVKRYQHNISVEYQTTSPAPITMTLSFSFLSSDPTKIQDTSGTYNEAQLCWKISELFGEGAIIPASGTYYLNGSNYIFGIIGVSENAEINSFMVRVFQPTDRTIVNLSLPAKHSSVKDTVVDLLA